jgi:hypothetical protein
MTATSANGWPALEADSPQLYTWTIPAKNGSLRIRLRNGSAGFLLCHFLLWWSERLDDLTHPHPADDWGYAWRPIRGQSTGLSNHASGTAADADATQWPLGTEHMSLWMRNRIRFRLKLYRGCLRWGGDYSGRKDQMHTEINKPLTACEKVAKRLMRTPRGKRLLAANPGQREVILS